MARRQHAPNASGLLGHLEYEVLTTLWSQAPASVPQVLARINAGRPEDARLAYTTVMTVLGRLHDKGLLDRTREGRGYAYEPRFDEPGLIAHLGRREIDDLLERYGGEIALAQFAAAVEDADPHLVARLRELVEQRDADA